jgi:dTMP kinase
MKGKLIIIESGSDASGKQTQTEKLFERLKNEGKNVKKITFPNYKSDSSSLIKMYLNGDFGKDPSDVNPYVSSTFFAVDRFASYKTEWENFYLNGGIVISDRYTTSNMVHQAAKLNDVEKEKFLNWLWNLEFILYGLPIPDLVIFLDMLPELSQKLLKNRLNKIDGNEKKDIHENNEEYLKKSYENSLKIADKYSWKKLKCYEDLRMKSIDEIHEQIYDFVKNIL